MIAGKAFEIWNVDKAAVTKLEALLAEAKARLAARDPQLKLVVESILARANSVLGPNEKVSSIVINQDGTATIILV